MDFRASDMERRLASLIRFGTVAEADYGAARVRVAMGGAVSDWLPWLTLRAGNDRTWWAPEVGEQVLVLSPSGEPAQGVVLGSIFQAAHPAPAVVPTVDRRVYADGAVIEYDREAHRLHALVPGDVVAEVSRDVNVRAGGRISATAGAGVEITAPRITLNGVIFLNGPLTQGGGSGGGSAIFNAALHAKGDITTDADVTAAVSLNGHVHPCPHGGETGGPK
ncbi:phage baseplate assembly protein V [Desulfobaculum xiamenense]|uniref:Phage baseplate assembly protein V n=1 Tax=Desulfobaculum xiamenense TaxID=995050 RepID=A0A846QL75_9BACT|nr:phage baseplate assembly protein V [Desulfobaculum xiamenense]NJB67212.1 phage baseplate assembly protein V [Desulfobaculum xiamenense]